jgi:hypothetical protein
MDTVKLRSRTDKNGILHLNIPLARQNTELEVTVTFASIQSQSEPSEDLGWREGFFDRTAGAWSGTPLVRGEQGEYPQREELA